MRLLLLAALFAVAALPSAAAGGQLRTAVALTTDQPLAFERTRETGANVIRITLDWANVAPPQRPAGFDPADPADPAYDWSWVDRNVKLAVANGLEPLLTVASPPAWAQKDEPHPTQLGPYPIGGWKPNATQLKAFAHAAATRYGGSFRDLPRVRYWEVWNESNLSQYLSPQVDKGKVVSPRFYRPVVNAFADAAHAVHPDNVVAAGSVSGFKFTTPYGRLGIAPLLFMRKLLCMSGGPHPKPTCQARVTFDAWSVHPWTSGGPTHHAAERDDVSLGDLHKMHRLLAAAFRAGQIRAKHMPEFWITEFDWDTRPPDVHPDAAPIRLQARWISEALYRSWREGVSLFTWFLLWDRPNQISPFQGGLFFRNGEDLAVAQPKPSFYSFRFPFVAYRHGQRIAVWGRTPRGDPGRVAVQMRGRSGWRWLGGFEANRQGIFSGTVRYHPLPKATRVESRADATAYRNLVVSARPMSYWRLDDRIGPSVQEVMNGFDGTIVGNVQLGSAGAFPGSTAATFDGRSGRIALWNVTSLHTVELWVKTKTQADVAAFSNRNEEHSFTNVGLAAGMAHAFDDYPMWAKVIADNRWHYLVYTYDTPRSTGRLYVDGKQETYAVFPRREGGAPASLGYDSYVKTFFKGQIDEVAIYSYPLTAKQIREHYAASGRSLPPNVAPGTLRAVEETTKLASLPFSLKHSADRFVLPFGGGGTLSP